MMINLSCNLSCTGCSTEIDDEDALSIYHLITMFDDYDNYDYDYDYHPKSEQLCGVSFSVSRNVREKCVNLDDKILQQ